MAEAIIILGVLTLLTNGQGRNGSRREGGCGSIFLAILWILILVAACQS